jgi:hypothetical protein
VESKNLKSIEAGDRMLVARDLQVEGLGRMGRCWSKNTHIQLQDDQVLIIRCAEWLMMDVFI